MFELSESSQLLTIGRFARMCWLSVRALRLYDETGLLHPAYVDPLTSYRYYSAEQAPTARAIAILRSLDMPLPEVREIVNEVDPEQIRARLDLHRAAIEERIERDRQKLCRVEELIRKGAVMSYDIELKDIEGTDVVGVTLKTSPESVGTDAAPAFHQVFDGLAARGIGPAAPPRMVYHEMGEDSWTVEVCVPVSGVTEAPDGLTLRRMNGGRAVTTFHRGPYDELGMAYGELEMWIEKNGLTPVDLPYDVYLNDPSQVTDASKLETQVVWPVR